MKNYTITEIEAMTEQQVQEIAAEHLSIKVHDIYFADIAGAFGYSVLVFFNGNQFKYANDYELHHPCKTREELRELYIRQMEHKLFTEDEISGPILDYNEYTAKCNYLINYYSHQHGSVSIYCICRTEAEKQERQRQIASMTFNPCVFRYYPEREFSDKITSLFEVLNQRLAEKAHDFSYWKEAFRSEMYNHEYAINWEADYDTLGAFGTLKWSDHVSQREALQDYFDQLNFTIEQRAAYRAAYKQYWQEQEGA